MEDTSKFHELQNISTYFGVDFWQNPLEIDNLGWIIAMLRNFRTVSSTVTVNIAKKRWEARHLPKFL